MKSLPTLNCLRQKILAFDHIEETHICQMNDGLPLPILILLHCDAEYGICKPTV